MVVFTGKMCQKHLWKSGTLSKDKWHFNVKYLSSTGVFTGVASKNKLPDFYISGR